MSDNLKDPHNPSGPVSVRNLHVRIDRDLCIGAATCSAVASLTFALDEHNKAVILDTVEQESDQQIIEAAQSCPVLAIIVENEKGERVFPK